MIAHGFRHQIVDDNRGYLLVLLVTPESLHHVQNNEDSLLQSLFQRQLASTLHVDVSVLVAVVDAIPHPQELLADQNARYTSSLGHQGISVAVLELEKAAHHIWSNDNASTLIQQKDGALPHLAFSFFGTYVSANILKFVENPLCA